MGDDYFKIIFNKIFDKSKNNLLFYDPSKINELPIHTDILVCGGGDIITPYFTEKILELKYNFEKKYNKKILSYAISIGITYTAQIKNVYIKINPLLEPKFTL